MLLRNELRREDAQTDPSADEEAYGNAHDGPADVQLAADGVSYEVLATDAVSDVSAADG